MSTSSLSPAGSSTYSSNTLHVGDGTWDASRDTYLLPNIQGLNYATMRYNGMGNRFRGLTEYHGLIRAHGIIAAITFLGLVPAAIFVARFYYRDPRSALRMHISLQIFTVILSTVVLILGYFSVGPSRSLSNPHHGIGIAIYAMVMVQAIGGWLIHKIEKGKTRYYIPVKLMLHQWLGRATALLAFAQIPIGLTLYGSPLYLFILYAVFMFFLLVAYFWLTFDSHKRAALGGYDGQGSYVSGNQTELTNNRQGNDGRSGLGGLTGAFAGGVGLEALRQRFSNRNRRTDGRSDTGYSQGQQSRFGSESYVTEKYTDDGRGGSWRDRLFGGATGIGAAMGIKKFRDRQKANDDRNYEGGYQRNEQNGAVSQSTERFQNLEEGRPLVNTNNQNVNGPQGNQGYNNANDNWRRVEQMEAAQAAQSSQQQSNSQFRPSYQGNRRGESNLSYESGNSDTSRKGFAAKFATAGGLGEFFKRRRSKKEQRRIDAQRQREHEEERVFGNRRPSQPANIGDDVPRRDNGFPPSHVSFREPLTADQAQPPNPGTTATALGNGDVPIGSNQYNAASSNMPPTQRPSQTFAMGPPPPPSHQDFAQQPQRSQPDGHSSPYAQAPQNQNRPYQPYNSRTNLNSPPYRGTPPRVDPQHQSHINLPAPPPVMSPPRNSPRAGADPIYNQPIQTQPGTIASPPVSVKVRVHNDRVTLRRLNEEEAAMERDRRRGPQQQPTPQQQPLYQQHQNPAYSDISAFNPSTGGSGGPNTHSRRQQHSSTSPGPAYPSAPMPPRQTILQVPPEPQNHPQYPQPQYQTSSPPAAMGSSPIGTGTGTYYDTGTGTDVSNYDTNRRRRRAERARAEQARLAARMGSSMQGGYGGGGPVGGPELHLDEGGNGGGGGGGGGQGGRRVDFV